ncbi:hypothetical protein L6452_30744 [Arctium lappa]|uniref:Uncharacterized protein n=1 Tax=Arctium lappa TaxID=4217 RepID=A0ACB8ZI59_ARCLA|nr:hypothetical protein L6452_30744 [Arctium lappa]
MEASLAWVCPSFNSTNCSNTLETELLIAGYIISYVYVSILSSSLSVWRTKAPKTQGSCLSKLIPLIHFDSYRARGLLGSPSKTQTSSIVQWVTMGCNWGR